MAVEDYLHVDRDLDDPQALNGLFQEEQPQGCESTYMDNDVRLCDSILESVRMLRALALIWGYDRVRDMPLNHQTITETVRLHLFTSPAAMLHVATCSVALIGQGASFVEQARISEPIVCRSLFDSWRTSTICVCVRICQVRAHG